MKSRSGSARKAPCASANSGWRDDEGRYQLLSRNFKKSFGQRLGDGLGKTDHELWPKAIAHQFVANDREVIAADRMIEVIESAPTPNGGMIWCQINKFSYRDSSGRRFVGGLGVDITARIKAEEALRASEQRLRRFYDSGLLGVLYWNMNGEIVDANDKFLGPDAPSMAGARPHTMSRRPFLRG